jgi:hypothetical protein
MLARQDTGISFIYCDRATIIMVNYGILKHIISKFFKPSSCETIKFIAYATIIKPGQPELSCSLPRL